MSPDVCKCLPTWTGLRCETGTQLRRYNNIALLHSYTSNDLIFFDVVMVPVVLSSERISATSLRVELEQVTVNQTIGVVNAYKVVIKEMQDGECSSMAIRVLDDIANLEVIVDELDPRKMYCIYVAAKTVAVVSEFSESMHVPCKYMKLS